MSGRGQDNRRRILEELDDFDDLPDPKATKYDDEFDIEEKLGEYKKDGEDDEDDLDAYMKQINQQVEKQVEEKKPEPLKRRDEYEEEDHVESYIRVMEEKGHEFGKAPIDDREDINSDEEVYAAAKAIDASGYDSEGNPISVKKDVEPLAAVDHSKIKYIEIEKNFYQEHADIAALAVEKVEEIRKNLEIRATGTEVPKPVTSFGHMGFDPELLQLIAKQGFSEPTGIQKQAIPCGLSGRDIIGIAKTGSGKTAAYLLPMLVHIMDQPELSKSDGPIGLILAPTRELCVQIYQESKKYGKVYNLNPMAVYGGSDKHEQFKELRKGFIEIIVATPGRFIDMIKMKATSLTRVSYVVLDEADRMFDMGFEPQVRSILKNVRPDRQTLLFSATFPKKIERLCQDILSDPVKIIVGGVGEANTDITQIPIVLRSDADKWPWCAVNLPGIVASGSVIIFVARRGVIDEVAANLRSNGYECGVIHGDLLQGERDKVIKEYKKGKFPILIATDVASRGLDIPVVKAVINYDVARDVDSHVHRIGRTGRAGQKGTAFTILTEKDDHFAGLLVRNMEYAGQVVTEDLMKLAMMNSKFRNMRQGIGMRGSGGKKGRGGKSSGPSRAGIGSGDSSSYSRPSHSGTAPSMTFQRASQPASNGGIPPSMAFQRASQPASNGGMAPSMTFQRSSQVPSTLAPSSTFQRASQPSGSQAPSSSFVKSSSNDRTNDQTLQGVKKSRWDKQ